MKAFAKYSVNLMHVLFTDKYFKDGSPAASSHNFRPKGRTTMPEPGILPFHDSFFARKSPRHQVFCLVLRA
jgi:hypothetical protein